MNTVLGKAFDKEHFKAWMKQPNNYAIMDAATGKDFYDEFHALDRVIFSNFIAGITRESMLRLSQKVLANISAFLAGKPINMLG